MGFKRRRQAPGPVAAYVRVSSRGQDAATQRSAIEEAAGARGDEIATWYTDTRAGRSAKRPQLERLRKDARTGKLGTIYLHRLDRFTRSGVRDTLALVEELRESGCEVISIADGFDLSSSAAEVILAVMSWASRVERQAINERIAAARDRLEAAGESWGRPKRMNPTQIRRAQSLRQKGRSIREIAQALDVPKSTIQRTLNG